MMSGFQIINELGRLYYLVYQLLPLLTGNTPEYRVFKKNYAALVDTLRVNDLYSYFVPEEIITLSDQQDISDENNSRKKIEIVLKKIWASLKNGYTELLYRLLRVMMEHGNLDIRKLADTIKESIYDLKSCSNGIQYFV